VSCTCIDITQWVVTVLTSHCELWLYWHHTVSCTCIDITLWVVTVLTSHCELYLYWHHTVSCTCIDITQWVVPVLTSHCELWLYWYYTVSCNCTDITQWVVPVLTSHCELWLYWHHIVSCTCIDITLWVTPVWITRLWVSHWVIPVHSDCECHYDMHALPPSQQLPSTLPSTITYNILNMLHAEILNTCRFITTILTLRTCLHCCHHEKVHQVAADPTTKSTNCGCESACTLLSSTLTITVYYYSAQQLILIFPSHRQ